MDTGKSTLTTFIANSCVNLHGRVTVIDGDVGQADIGPPTTTSSATVTRQVYSLGELEPERSYFVGDTSPSLVPEKLERSLQRLRERIPKENDVLIVNTDGWLREDNAIRHKINLLETLQPDLVLALSSDSELDPILDSQKCPFLQLKPSEFAQKRTRDQRKKTREEGYRRFLDNSTNIDLRLSTIKLRTFNLPRQERMDYSSTHKGNLAGLLDEEDQLIAVGRILGIEKGRIRITTRAREIPKTVELGAVILSSGFEEKGFEN